MCASWRKIINKEVKERATEGSKDQPPSSPLLPDRTQLVRPHRGTSRCKGGRRGGCHRGCTRFCSGSCTGDHSRGSSRGCLGTCSGDCVCGCRTLPPHPCLCSAFQRRQLRAQVWVRGPPHPADTAWRAWGLGGSWGSDPRRHQSAVEAQGEAQRQQDLPLTTPMVPYWLVFSYFIIYQYNCNCFP